MAEDYSRAKTLATIDFMGETFHVIRRRFNGKPWRKYLTLLHEGAPVVETILRETDPQKVADLWRAQLTRAFQTPEALKAGIENYRKPAS